MSSELHLPVLSASVIHALQVRPDGCYVDATYGRGGHSRLILERLGPKGRLWVIDRDPEAVAHAQAHFQGDERVSIHHASFESIAEIVRGVPLDAVLFDLGVSSTQLDTAERGFSFRYDAPLDMRFDPESGVPVHVWLNQASVSELADVLYYYGEETRARAVARAIVAERASGPILTTQALARLVASVVTRGSVHPATRTFQALRMYVNDELGHVERALLSVGSSLMVGGRLLVLTFHGLETRMLKSLLRKEPLLEGGQIPGTEYRRVGRDKASLWECRSNRRARSAQLFILEKIS